jgi:hypothetical protein
VWPFRDDFPAATVDRLTVISVAGMVAEVLAFGNARGGRVDLEQLQQILESAESEEQRIRFAVGFTFCVLRRHLRQLDALVGVMERGGSVPECIQAIEEEEEEEKVVSSYSKDTLYDDDYEVRRRAAFRSQSRLWWERNEPHIDDETIGVRKEAENAGFPLFLLSGDDPLYLALAVATVFGAWASAGGISLH